MIVVANRIPVNPDFADAFEERFRDRQGLVDQMPGFIKFQILKPTTEEAPYIVQTYWESHEHFIAWTESDEFRQGHSKSGRLPQDAFRGKSALEIHEVMVMTEKATDDGA